MSSLAILSLFATATTTCDVTLLGDPLLVADIRVRMNLAKDDRTRCEPVVVQVEDHADGVAVLIARDGHRFERVVADVDRATVLIESRVFVPEEALDVLAELAPRAFVAPPPPPPKRVESPRTPRAPRVVFDPRTGEPMPIVAAAEPKPDPDDRPQPSSVRRPIGARLKRLMESSAITEIAREERRGLDVLVGASAELTIIDDGSVWTGPAVEGAVSDGRWSGGVALRLAKRPADGSGTLIEFQPQVGRDFVWSRIRLEPRATFGVRTIQETQPGTWVSPCGFINCNFSTNVPVDGPSRVGFQRIDVMIGARLTAVFALSGPLSAWTMAELAVPLASRVTPDDSTAGLFDASAGRLSVGARLAL